MLLENVDQVSINELSPTDGTIFVVCSNGNSRSKAVARILDQLGHPQARAIGINQLHRLDPDIKDELETSKVIICVASDVLAAFKAYDKGRLARGKKIINLNLSESAHAVINQQNPPEEGGRVFKKACESS